MSKFFKVLGYIWSAPVTVFGLVYALLFNLLGWYAWCGVFGDALVWVVKTDKAPTWLLNLWKKWAGHTIGNVVVLKQTPAARPVILTHEQKHVDQCMRLGVFQPLVYALSYLALKFGCTGSDPYYSNPFEIDARRAAGQIVDVEGRLKRIVEQNKKA